MTVIRRGWDWFWALRWRWKASIIVLVTLIVIGALSPTETNDSSTDEANSSAGIVVSTSTPTTAATSTTAPVPTAESESESSSACEQAFNNAASISSMEDTIEDLNSAIRACEKLDEWNAASLKHPSALDGADPTAFLRNRCRSDETLSREPLCREVNDDFSPFEARDRVVECLQGVGASDKVEDEIAALRRGVSALQLDSGWFIERSDPAKFDLPGFPVWNVSPDGRVTAITDEAAALTPDGSDLLCGA